MPVASIELTARNENLNQPVVWRLGRLFHVIPNITRARISDDFGYVVLELEGAEPAIQEAKDYLRAMGLMGDSGASAAVVSRRPEDDLPNSTSITLELGTVAEGQGKVPALYRVAKDYDVVVNIESGLFDAEEGGMLVITLTGNLNQVQRAIAYLHTTGLRVFPYQRSVSDNSNL